MGCGQNKATAGGKRTRPRSNSLQQPDLTHAVWPLEDSFATVGSKPKRDAASLPSLWNANRPSSLPSTPLPSSRQLPAKDKAHKQPFTTKPDNVPRPLWLKSNPFMRPGDSNAIFADQWLALTDKAFPGDITFVGGLLLTELWLAVRVLPTDLWKVRCGLVVTTLTDINNGIKGPSFSPHKGHSTVDKLWTFICSFRLSSLDRACQQHNIPIISTDTTDGDTAGQDLVSYGFFKNQDLKAKTVCRHIPTVAQRSQGDGIDRESDPPISEAINSICWIVFFGARSSVSCTAWTTSDECNCPYHIRFSPSAPLGQISQDDRFNLARSRAQLFFAVDLEMPLNCKALGTLNKRGGTCVAKMVRRRSLKPLYSLAALNNEPFLPKATPSSPTTDVAQSERPQSLIIFHLGPSASSAPTDVLDDTGFVAKAVKVRKTKPIIVRRPQPLATRPVEFVDDNTPDPGSSPDSSGSSKAAVLATAKIIPVPRDPGHKAPKRARRKPPSTTMPHTVTSPPASPPSASPTPAVVPKTVTPPHSPQPFPDRAPLILDLPNPSTLVPRTTPRTPLSPTERRRAIRDLRAEQRFLAMDLASVDYQVPGLRDTDPVYIGVTYHLFQNSGRTITLQRSSRFSELHEQWMAYVVSETAKWPSSVIPPHRYMFVWKGRSLKLTESPSSVDMSEKEEVHVLDSMDAAIALRTHDAGLCNEILRAVVFRDMVRVEQGLDALPEGMALSLEIAKRYEANSTLKEEETKLSAAGKLVNPPEDVVMAATIAQLRSATLGHTPLGQLHTRHHSQGTPSRRRQSTGVILPPNRSLFGSSANDPTSPAGVPRRRPRPSLPVLTSSSLSSTTSSIGSKGELPESPLRPLKLVSRLSISGTSQTLNTKRPPSPSTPTRTSPIKDYPILMSTPPRQCLRGYSNNVLQLSTCNSKSTTVSSEQPPELPFTRSPGPTCQTPSRTKEPPVPPAKGTAPRPVPAAWLRGDVSPEVFGGGNLRPDTPTPRMRAAPGMFTGHSSSPVDTVKGPRPPVARRWDTPSSQAIDHLYYGQPYTPPPMNQPEAGWRGAFRAGFKGIWG